MKSLTVFILASFMSSFAFASDAWSTCSSSDGYATMVWDQLEVENQGVIPQNSFEVEEVQVISEEDRSCVLKNAQITVQSFYNKTTVKKVTYDLHEPGMFPASVVYMICEEGGSGIPANDACEGDEF